MNEDIHIEAEIRALTEAERPSLNTLDRLEERVLRSMRVPARRSPPWGALAGAALAAAALVVAGVALRGSQPAAPVAVALNGGPVQVAQGIEAEVEGRGHATTEGEHTVVAWEEGEVTVEMEGAPGRSLTIETAEAQVRVVGTRLSVERRPFGTRVSVAHGRVETECVGLPERHTLEAGDEVLCLRHAAAGIGYVLLLESDGAPPLRRLQVIERALDYPASVAETRTLLRESQIEALTELGRHTAAVDVASRLPAAAREQTMLDEAAKAMARGDCASAEPWLNALAESGHPTGALLHVQCLARHDVERARQVLHTIERERLTPAQQEIWDRWERMLR